MSRASSLEKLSGGLFSLFNAATRDQGQKTALCSMRGGCPGPVVPYRTWTIMKFIEIGEIIIIYCEAFINFCVPSFFLKKLINNNIFNNIQFDHNKVISASNNAINKRICECRVNLACSSVVSHQPKLFQKFLNLSVSSI